MGCKTVTKSMFFKAFFFKYIFKTWRNASNTWLLFVAAWAPRLSMRLSRAAYVEQHKGQSRREAPLPPRPRPCRKRAILFFKHFLLTQQFSIKNTMVFLIPPQELFLRLQFENHLPGKTAKQGFLFGTEASRRALSSPDLGVFGGLFLSFC